MVSDAYPDFGAVALRRNTTATFALNLYEPMRMPRWPMQALAAASGGAVLRQQASTLIDPFGVRWMIATHVRDVAQADVTSAVEHRQLLRTSACWWRLNAWHHHFDRRAVGDAQVASPSRSWGCVAFAVEPAQQVGRG